jgi:hypothetical protein
MFIAFVEILNNLRKKIYLLIRIIKLTFKPLEVLSLPSRIRLDHDSPLLITQICLVWTKMPSMDTLNHKTPHCEMDNCDLKNKPSSDTTYIGSFAEVKQSEIHGLGDFVTFLLFTKY